MKTTLRSFLLLFLFVAVCSAAPNPAPRPKSVITLKDLEDMFSNMRKETKWDLNGDMLWGYFFTDRDPKKLEPVAKHLSAAGYRVVSIYPADDNSIHWLHVERIEHHTAKSLHIRNQELSALATKFGIEDYDGMDVGPAPLKGK